MAGPDNVARIIAAVAALGTALNMAITYANYRRKRPRLTFRRTLDDATQVVMKHDGSGLVGQPLFAVHLRNLGETTIRVVAVHIEKGPALTRWWQRLRYRVSRGRSWKVEHTHRLTLQGFGGPPVSYWNDPYYDLPVPEDGHITLEAFEEVGVRYMLPGETYPNFLQSMELDERARLSVELPGSRRLYGTLWRPAHNGPSPIPRKPKDQQMAFDDLME